jgi:hypothetical protein
MKEAMGRLGFRCRNRPGEVAQSAWHWQLSFEWLTPTPLANSFTGGDFF